MNEKEKILLLKLLSMLEDELNIIRSLCPFYKYSKRQIEARLLNINALTYEIFAIINDRGLSDNPRK